MKIKQLETELATEEENYVNGVKAHKSYQTLKSIRTNIHEIKEELQALYSMQSK